MRNIKIFGTLLIMGFSGTLLAQSKTTKQTTPPVVQKPFLNTLADSASYAIGYDLVTSLRNQGLDGLNKDIIIQAIKDVYENKKSLLTEEQIHMSISDFLQKAKADKLAANKAKGEEFLNSNKNNPGVVTLPSGLQYLVITEGTGEKPTIADRVRCHYRGTLLDGTVFDSSYDRGEPAVFPVGGVIKGWVEALPLMATGSKWKLFIPSELAYGEQQAGAKIGPNSTLIFEVELLEVVKY